MNYPRAIDKHWFKPDSEMKHFEVKQTKDTRTLFQKDAFVSPVLLRGQLDDALSRKQPDKGQFHQLKKPSTRVLTTTDVDYQRGMISATNNTVVDGFECSNVMPVSNTVHRSRTADPARDYQNVIWNFEDTMRKRIPVDYKSEDARHFAVSLHDLENR